MARTMVTVPALTEQTREIADKLLNTDTPPLHRRFAVSRVVVVVVVVVVHGDDEQRAKKRREATLPLSRRIQEYIFV